MNIMNSDTFDAESGKTYYFLIFNDDFSEHTIESYTPEINEKLSKSIFFEHKEDITQDIIDETRKEIKETQESLAAIMNKVGNKFLDIEKVTRNILDRLEKDVVVLSKNYEEQGRDQQTH